MATQNPRSANVPAEPVLAPEAVVEQLRAMRGQIAEVTPLTRAERQQLRRRANTSNPVLQASINMMGAHDQVSLAVAQPVEGVRRLYDEANRWTAVEDELRTMLEGVAGANLVRRERIALIAGQAYNIGTQLARDPANAVLRPSLEEIRRLKRSPRRKRQGSPRRRCLRHRSRKLVMGGRPGAFARARSFPSAERIMKRKDPDKPDLEWEERIEAAYLRLEAGLPPHPWLPNLPALTGLRRQVRRARAGVIAPGNPRISTRAWADTLEQGIVMNVLEREAWRKRIEEKKRQEEERRQKVLEYNRCWMEIYRELKRMPEASDPNSEVGAQVLAMKRELRKLRGRPRKRRKGRPRAGRE